MHNDPDIASRPQRRDILTGFGTALLATLLDASSTARAGEKPVPGPNVLPHLEWEFTAHIDWANGRNPTGIYRGGQRIYNTVAGGTFEGPRLKGAILPGGGDWAMMNPPEADLAHPAAGRSIVYDARYILRTDDGAHLYVTNRGGKFTEAPPSPGAPPKSGPGLSQPVFDVPLDSPYAFLARGIFVGVSEALANSTVLQVFRVAL